MRTDYESSHYYSNVCVVYHEKQRIPLKTIRINQHIIINFRVHFFNYLLPPNFNHD